MNSFLAVLAILVYLFVLKRSTFVVINSFIIICYLDSLIMSDFDCLSNFFKRVGLLATDGSEKKEKKVKKNKAVI